MALNNLKKQLLRPDKKLVIGDCLFEMDRFTKKGIIYQIIDIKDNWMKMKILAADDEYYINKVGKIYDGDFGAQSDHKNTRWITYFLPNARLLYAK